MKPDQKGRLFWFSRDIFKILKSCRVTQKSCERSSFQFCDVVVHSLLPSGVVVGSVEFLISTLSYPRMSAPSSRRSSFDNRDRRSSFAPATESRRGSLSLAFEGDLQRVKLLVEAGANMDETDANGWTPLYAAAERGHSDVVKYLCEIGVDMEKASQDGNK